MIEASRLSPLAYLTGEYPRATDTFIQREIAALRALGIEVITCSIRRTDDSHLVGPEQRAEARATYYVLEVARNPGRLLVDHIATFVISPRRWLSALALAWRCRSPGLKSLMWQLFYFAEAGVLARHLKRRGVRHLHNHFANSSCSVAMLTSEISGIPFGFTLHGPAIFFEPRRWHIDEKIARARYVACISHFCRSQAMIFSDPSYWTKLRIVHCGVEPTLYDRPKQTKEFHRLLFVGRLARVKGIAVLLESLVRLRERHPDLVLRLVGDGPDLGWLKSQARLLCIEDAVEITGYQSQAQVAEHLSEADVFVLPSFAEGVPVVLMEAMASRTPAVASRIAGVPELLEDGVTGFTVQPGDGEGLVAAIAELLEDPEQRREMGEAGRAKVQAEFDSAREARWLLKIMSAAAAGSMTEALRPRSSCYSELLDTPRDP